jgi:hypothetical protein
MRFFSSGLFFFNRPRIALWANSYPVKNRASNSPINSDFFKAEPGLWIPDVIPVYLSWGVQYCIFNLDDIRIVNWSCLVNNFKTHHPCRELSIMYIIIEQNMLHAYTYGSVLASWEGPHWGMTVQVDFHDEFKVIFEMISLHYICI